MSGGIGFIVPDNRRKNILTGDILGSIKFGVQNETVNYQGSEIVRSIGYKYSEESKEGREKIPWSVKARLKYDRQLFDGFYLTTVAGVAYEVKRDWYWSSDVRSFKDSDGPIPAPINANDLPNSPFVEGLAIYFGVGLKF